MKKNFLVVFLIIILITTGAVYYFYGVQKNSGNQVFCTQEALLCPDGSYVARHGNKCAFDSCPNKGPFEGRLKSDGSGFWLITDSPDKNSQGVAYAMPLEIKTSSASTELVGNKVKVFGVFGEGNTFKVDRFEDLGDVTLGEVGVGKTVFINGVRITLNKIVQDSRCPVGVQCIWAGSVTANITLKSDTDSETTTIESNKPPKAFDSFLISIENITPSKVVSQEIAPQNYVLTFKVVTSE